MKVVVRGEPSQRTTAPLTKFVPLTVNVNPALPSTAVFGLSEVMVGTGFGGLTVKGSAFEVPPPGAALNTVILIVPGLARSPAGIAAVSCELLTKVVGRFCPPQLITDEGTKLLPLTVNVNDPLPTSAEVGLRLVNCGSGLFP